MSTYALTALPSPATQFFGVDPVGAGLDAVRVEQRIFDLRNDYRRSFAITYREAALADLFHSLTEEWRSATRFQSSMAQITAHPSYRAIARLGDEVVPLLLRDMQRTHAPWFGALREITGIDPVRPDQHGDIRAMAEAWLCWGRERGLIR